MPETPLRVLFVIGTLDVGGTETQLVELATRLDPRRFDVAVCSLASEGPLAPRLRNGGVRVYSIGAAGVRSKRFPFLLSPAGAWRLLSGLWKVIRRERPAILHGMLFAAYVLGTFVGRAAGVPIVVASRRSLGLFKAGRPHYLIPERIANRMTDLIVANSEAVRVDTIARERVKPADIVVIRNGLDLSRFSAPPDPALAAALDVAGRPVVVVVANLIGYKGHEFFLRAWRDVLVRFPAAVCMLAGDGALRAALESLADELQIRHAVRFLGVRNDVPALLALADLYVHPSLQEGYSNALLEAMAAGKAVVATTVGGNVEAVSDGETGVFVPPGDAASLAAAMIALLADPPAARRMGERARRHVHETYDVGAMVRAYEGIYTRLLGSGSPSPERRASTPVPAAGRRD